MEKFGSVLLLALAFGVLSVVAQEAPTPVVMWHGMGDTAESVGMNSIKRVIEENTAEGTYVTSLEIGGSPGIIDFDERIAGFFGQVNNQVQEACEIIANDTNLANGYHAIGFSQGSQFLRAVAQRCPNPPMKNLVSMGGQHQGVFGFPGCPGEESALCDIMRRLLNLGAYLDPIQSILIQAQYWHDPLHYDLYVEKSQFIAEINNENNTDNGYAENLSQLEHFVMVMFDEDRMVEPKESQHFEFYYPGSDNVIQELRQSPIYTKDRIGLKTLDESGRLVFLNIPGADHLQFTEEWLIENIILPYFN